MERDDFSSSPIDRRLPALLQRTENETSSNSGVANLNTNRFIRAGLAIAFAGFAGAAHADWAGKGEVGYVQANGNTSASTLNGKLNLADSWDAWKEILDFTALRGVTTGVTTAQRYTAMAQTNYALTDRSYWFGNVDYRNDKFSGFNYQADLTTGYGYKIYDTKEVKLSAQVGVGYGRQEYAITDETKSNGVITAGFDFEDALTDTTKLVDKFGYVGGSADQFLHNFLGVEVKMSSALALAVGLDVQHHGSPPAGKKGTDELSTVNLVFAF